MFKYKTDKSLIKNGMYFQCNDKTYVKIGNCCLEIINDMNHIITFDTINQEDIKYIFKSNGQVLFDKQDND